MLQLGTHNTCIVLQVPSVYLALYFDVFKAAGVEEFRHCCVGQQDDQR